jgi:hypothetical protein
MVAPHVGWAAPLVGLVAEINGFVEPRARDGEPAAYRNGNLTNRQTLPPVDKQGEKL